jgi:hypothetical protein
LLDAAFIAPLSRGAHIDSVQDGRVMAGRLVLGCGEQRHFVATDGTSCHIFYRICLQRGYMRKVRKIFFAQFFTNFLKG